jgi:hypothetical protein
VLPCVVPSARISIGLFSLAQEIFCASSTGPVSVNGPRFSGRGRRAFWLAQGARARSARASSWASLRDSFVCPDFQECAASFLMADGKFRGRDCRIFGARDPAAGHFSASRFGFPAFRVGFPYLPACRAPGSSRPGLYVSALRGLVAFAVRPAGAPCICSQMMVAVLLQVSELPSAFYLPRIPRRPPSHEQ